MKKQKCKFAIIFIIRFEIRAMLVRATTHMTVRNIAQIYSLIKLVQDNRAREDLRFDTTCRVLYINLTKRICWIYKCCKKKVVIGLIFRRVNANDHVVASRDYFSVYLSSSICTYSVYMCVFNCSFWSDVYTHATHAHFVAREHRASNRCTEILPTGRTEDLIIVRIFFIYLSFAHMYHLRY
jgi:hypothetical protein